MICAAQNGIVWKDCLGFIILCMRLVLTWNKMVKQHDCVLDELKTFFSMATLVISVISNLT